MSRSGVIKILVINFTIKISCTTSFITTLSIFLFWTLADRCQAVHAWLVRSWVPLSLWVRKLWFPAGLLTHSMIIYLSDYLGSKKLRFFACLRLGNDGLRWSISKVIPVISQWIIFVYQEVRTQTMGFPHPAATAINIYNYTINVYK